MNNNNDIENFLEYSISNPEFLEILNNQRPLSDIISFDSLFQYMIEENKKYCAEHCLCENCRSEMKEYIDYDSEGRIAEMYWTCPNGCLV